jgi:hypothetical protein
MVDSNSIRLPACRLIPAGQRRKVVVTADYRIRFFIARSEATVEDD